MIIVNCPSYRHSYDDDGDNAEKREGIETVESCHRSPAIHRTDDAHQSEQHLYQKKQFQADWSLRQEPSQTIGEYRRQDQQHYGKHPCHYLERYAGKQEDGHHQNTKKHWENQQTREVLQEDEEHPFAATHMFRSLQIYVVHTEKHRECHIDTQQHRHIEHQLLVGYPGRNLRLRLFDGKWPGHSHEEGYEHRDDHNLLHSVEGLLQHKTEANQYHHY